GVTAPGSSSPVVAVRLFGWCMLATLLAFLVNNYLNLAMRWPGVGPVFYGAEATASSWMQLAIFVALALAAGAYVLGTRGRSLRADSHLISAFNRYLVRAAFWAVLLIGLADFAISFLRVEGLLAQVVGEELTTELGRSRYRGPNVHVPLMIAGAVMALFTRTLGFPWLALLIVVAELAIVITRFVFSYEQAFMGDLVRFWYAALFLFASAYTLLEEGHVRVDVFYAGFGLRTKGFVNAIGTIVLGMSVCWVILAVGMGGSAAIINSPMMNFEVSQSGFGMYTKYLMAGFLGVFAITMLIQFVSYLLEAVADFRGEPGHLEHDEPPVP
ncbi:MAG: TRAP transporter small permease subunit, partial [Gammaproteobacteria bacterium]